MKIKECCTVESQECIAKGIYSMWISTKVIAKEAKAGQFISLFSKDGSRLLPRPISLSEIDREGGKLRIVYRVAGAGTEEFSHLKAGDEVDILGPLGNGFPLEEGKGKRVMLMGGGIGVPPMLQTAKELGSDTIICCGYRDELFLNEEFAAAGDLHIATEDGSAGVKGNVMDVVREDHLEADVIFACGPAPMLRAIKAYGLEKGIPCWISMEEKMACGVGACLACVCQSAEVDEHSHVHNKRICKDGPVYGGMLNAIGLQNPGIDVFCKRDIPFLKQFDTKIIVNVCGKTTEDYCEVVERLASEPVDLLEINISCPNVKEGGIAFGQDPKAVEAITKEVKKYAKQPIIMKLSPNVTDITEMARAAEAGGADVLSLINTLTGMKIDIERQKFAIANKTGGMSGPAVKPIAVRMVYQVAQAVKVPLIGMGGISSAEDALEFILAGATAVSIGTANFFNPYATVETVRGIEEYMRRHNVDDICSLIGAVR